MDKDEHGKQSEQIVSIQKSGYLVFLMELALFGIRSINPGFRLANIKSKFDLSQLLQIGNNLQRALKRPCSKIELHL